MYLVIFPFFMRTFIIENIRFISPELSSLSVKHFIFTHKFKKGFFMLKDVIFLELVCFLGKCHYFKLTFLGKRKAFEVFQNFGDFLCVFILALLGQFTVSKKEHLYCKLCRS